MTSQPMSVRVSVEVSLEPQAAFDVFTGEIDAWYRKNERTLADPGRAAAIRFEPGVGGRLLEVYDLQQGGGREMGRITAWEPGRRLVFVDQLGTEVEVLFDGADGQTRVTLEHAGWSGCGPRRPSGMPGTAGRCCCPGTGGTREIHRARQATGQGALHER